MGAQFKVYQDSDYLLIQVAGRIISDESLGECLQEVDKHLTSNSYKVVICQCSELEYSNSTGLNFFIRVLTRARKQGLDCVLVDLKPSVQKLFEISKLNEIFSCFSSVEDVKSKIR